MTNLDNNLEGSAKYSDNYRGNKTINSLGPNCLLKTQFFEKIGITSNEEEILAHFLSDNRV